MGDWKGPAASLGGGSSSEVGKMAVPVDDFDWALAWRLRGSTGKLSLHSIWPAGDHRGGSTVSSWAAAMVDMARLN